MGVVGSLPSPPPALSGTNDTIKTLYEESMPSSDEFSYCVKTIDEADTNSNSCSNSDITNEHNTSEFVRQKDLINTVYTSRISKSRRSTAPTLATGRRSKFIELEGDAAIKRELRRKRNREAARKLKEKRAILEEKLQSDIQELETKEKELLSRIRNLESHKEELETQYKHIVTIQETIARTANSTLKHIEDHCRRLNSITPNHQNDTYIKDEPDPPSPQWQILFKI